MWPTNYLIALKIVIAKGYIDFQASSQVEFLLYYCEPHLFMYLRATHHAVCFTVCSQIA